MNHFYVTTPIYYVNAEPHIGHAYTTIVSDVLNRFHKLLGYKTFFLTGTDEHGDKIVQAAQEAGMDPKTYADRISGLFRETWPKLNIGNDYFIRTTDPKHVRVVQGILQKVRDSGDIYFSSYKGLYCIGCERFYTERELVDGKCPDHDREPVEREEANYFFRMSKYQGWLIEYIESNPDFIRPERYRNEVLSFLREPLEDLCISRPRERLNWGIPLPFDDRYVTYVWFDALINYVSAIGYPDGPLFREFWPSAHHMIAKDILKPHGIYWPTMIRAAGFPLFRSLNVHGYWKINEGKMSKSKGSVIRPLDLVPIYGLDAFRYFLLREMVFGLDANFSEEALIQRINSDLANDLGNLFSRTLAMTSKYFGGNVPPFGSQPDAMDQELMGHAREAVQTVIEEIPKLGFHKALISIWECINAANKYIDHAGPWNLAKDPAMKGRLQTVIRNALEVNRTVAVLIAPFMPSTAEKMLERLGVVKPIDELRLNEDAAWGSLVEGVPVNKGEALFPRIEVKESGKMPEKPLGRKGEMEREAISIDMFQKIDIRVGIVKQAERIPKSTKLLRLVVDIGEERQVVAGIAQHYSPEDLTGKQVVLVANLQPAKLMGVESHGMVLAAHDGNVLRIVTPEQTVAPGAKVS
ncbi:MAG: methionine--tRNA ligase [Deltaproteobacteria bacterium]|jgi:methionyl-tRNA synthetase|nr:methionine--tRNA ligase [Deltaproteobacteria bacterium]